MPDGMTIGQLAKNAGVDGRILGFLETCVVVTDRRIIQGMLRDGGLDANSGVTAGEVMRPGLTTYKPNMGPVEAADRLREWGEAHTSSSPRRTEPWWAYSGGRTPNRQ